jgi:protein-S-isoprenylcysteine O-methyltransferase Ste14/membrane-associated phospholipid phosphatase
MQTVKTTIGKILYALLFVLILPLLIFLWAKNTSWIINLPVPKIEYPGYLLIFTGILLIVAGFHNIMTFGKGLPMNAFPPKLFVRKGIYSIIKHPIYTGAIFLCFGVSVILHSASGLWLVSPIFTLMVIAYITGFENERTIKIFGKQEYRTFFSLPRDEESNPNINERISAYFTAFLPWLIAYETFILAGNPRDAIITNLSFELKIPVLEFTVIFYVSIYLMALMIPLIIRTRKLLRQFITDIWLASLIAGLAYFAFPFTVLPREIETHTFLGKLLFLDRSLDGVTSSLPSFHVIWAFVAARYFTIIYKRFKAVWYLLAALISISCVTTGAHSILDVLAGLGCYTIVHYRIKIWDTVRQITEKIANSWKEWRVGPVRLINHGLYGGAAGFIGFMITCAFAGPGNSFVCFIVFVLIIIGAGLWAQVIEGSSALLRPYGYYGGLIGAMAGCVLVAVIFKRDVLVLSASFAMAAPWIQSIGRLRCLVQGCCHGKQCDEKLGIRFTHPLSRVNKISGLKGAPVYPTQLYSILCNVITGLILLRLYSLNMPVLFICGIYMILSGLGRFVEESLRGEAQTPYRAGMRIYQWLAIVSIFIGAILTCVPNKTTLSFSFNIENIFLALITGLVVLFASGIDFPDSDRRFSRLTS